jgi:hypothetical protein
VQLFKAEPEGRVEDGSLNPEYCPQIKQLLRVMAVSPDCEEVACGGDWPGIF